MKLLLDTHVWLWAVLTPDSAWRRRRASHSKMPQHAPNLGGQRLGDRNQARDRQAPLPRRPGGLIPSGRAAIGGVELPMTARHAVVAAALPFHHRNPFDRMLIAQSLGESAALVTADGGVTDYGATALWAGTT